MPKCKLFDQLCFLQDTVCNRPTTSNIQHLESDSPTTPPAAEGNSVQSIDSPNTPCPPSSTTRNFACTDCSLKSQKSKVQKIDPVDHALLKALNEDTTRVETDPDVAFAHSIIPILRALP